MFTLWKLRDYAPGEGVAGGAATAPLDDGWIPVSVPGDVHGALLEAGRIEDPFYDRNEDACAWMEAREWWYRLDFPGPSEPLHPGERLQLVFHGLDTYATVWLNGKELGRHANMFREAVFEVTDRLEISATNTLALCFDRPLDHVNGLDISTWGRNTERVAMRKAQFGYGWDWGPRLPTIGIWQPVELRRQRLAAISGVHFATVAIDQAQEQAVVQVRVEADRFATTEPLTITISLDDDQAGPAPVATATLRLSDGPGAATAAAYLTIDHPRLWWTHDLGQPVLHTLTTRLYQEGVELDRRESRVGIRALVLDQSVDVEERGCRFFRFVLNGVPIFAKGADWIPADSFVGAIPEERYRMLLGAARDANMNMLRIWGGGIYEHDIFYDLCDQLGMLVWQDFMFACAMYPEHDEGFAAEVEAEAAFQVRRLRSHPSLALWCGNNENQWLHDRTYWDRADYPVPGSRYYNQILPDAVAAYDGYTPYWPGSPYGGNDYSSYEDGNRHNWEVWHGNYPRRFGEEPRRINTPESVSYRRYAEDMGRFISEFGMHASPVMETLSRVIPEDQRYHHSPALDHHNKDNPKNKGDMLMQGVTGLPESLDEYIDYSMIAQAEGLKFGIEHYRRRMPHCSGTLVWQLNDCWPVLSWSVLDYYGRGKAGYYYLKRVYAPILASFKELPEDGLELWITNDSGDDLRDEIVPRLATFSGEIIREESLTILAPARSSQPVKRWNAAELGAGADRYYGVRSATNRFLENRHFFVPIKDLQRQPAQVTMLVTPIDDHHLQVELHADHFAYFVHLSFPETGTHFTDNFFDLPAGSSRTISVTNQDAALTLEKLTVQWR